MSTVNRASGIFLHPTSLPSRFGIGDLGENAFRWIDLLSESRQLFWQMCPLGPTGYGDSPYQSLCSFAGNDLLVSPEKLGELELLTVEELEAYPAMKDGPVDFGTVIAEKDRLFRMAYARFNDSADYLDFCEREKYWLEDYALFRVLKEQHGGKSWVEWDTPFKLRFPAALDELRAAERRAIRYQKFLQYMFHVQWGKLREHAQQSGVKIIGDMPYYVAYDSSDTWASPDLFELDEKGQTLRVAGVPPDYFSATGQLWGNPLYRWENMRQDGFAWWIRRIKKTLHVADYLRLDHFRAFESYWAIPAGNETAIEGTWETGPCDDFFTAVRNELGSIPIIAEDLGEITAGVEELRKRIGLPGMKVLQFAFDGDFSNPYLPFNVEADSIMFTGTHDNNTSAGWYAGLEEAERTFVSRFLGCTDKTFLDRFLRLAFCSSSRLCLIPFQDVLGLPGSARMNTPGTKSGNWRWRMKPADLAAKSLEAVKEYTEVYGREPDQDFIL